MDTVQLYWTPALWSRAFNQQVDHELKHGWTLQFNYSLTENLTTADINRRWEIYRHTVLRRCRCRNCPINWDSDTAEVYFRYRLRCTKGTIIMMPICQVCPGCGKDSQQPGFSPDEVRDTLLRLFETIRDKYDLERPNPLQHAMEGLQLLDPPPE